MTEKEELLEEIEKLKKEKILCIVEGPKDRRALNELGIEKVETLSKAPLYKIVEETTAEEVAVLTDLDQKGKELYHILSRDLQKKGVRINNRLRQKLFRAKISHIEGLA